MRSLFPDEIVAKKPRKPPHHSIFAIGACKYARGLGDGSVLMRKCIEIAHAEDMPICLENSKGQSLGFYHK